MYEFQSTFNLFYQSFKQKGFKVSDNDYNHPTMYFIVYDVYSNKLT